MSALLLTGMVVCFLLLVAAVVAHHRAPAALEPDHAEDCRHCAALRHPSQNAARAALSTIPRAREGQ
ncbi:hypothetical protein [Streptomyces sp. NPDC055912]|uniref:hypothetical protein n=1 Tax=unclassified Streptomyces TaxID=2593676 RepID=UPI0035DFCEFE